MNKKTARSDKGKKAESFETAKTSERVCSKTVGLVAYMEPEKYEGLSIADIHIELKKSEFVNELKEQLEVKFNNRIASVIVGHEHGESNGKCHFQCMISFVKKLDRQIAHFKIAKDGIVLLCMFQKAKNPNALANYCKKEKDFEEFNFKGDLIKNSDDIWTSLTEHDNLSKDEFTAALKEKDPKALLMWGDKIKSNYDAFVKKEEIPEFEWTFPKHIIEFMEDESKTSSKDEEIKAKYKAMFNWFNEFCTPEEMQRRRALFIVSTERGLGKSEFAKRLVPHEAYYIYCRNTLNGFEFREKKDTAKLIILDDVSFIGSEREMWKALVSGEEVNIRTAYVNEKWKGGLPCIILTNEISTAEYWSSSDNFATQCTFVDIDSYMGPPGTRPSFLSQRDIHFSSSFLAKLDEFRASRDARKPNFK